MRIRRSSRHRRGAIAALAIALAAAGAIAVLPAAAASEDVSFTLSSGELSVGDQAFSLPTTSGLNATIDDATGALAGTFVFPVIVQDLTQPFPVKVKVALVQQGDATGTIDLATGATTLAATVRIGLEIRTAADALLVGGSCGIGPVSLTFEGTYDAPGGTMTLEDEGFVLPASSGCASPGVDFGPIIDDLLGGATSATLVLSTSDTPVTTPTTGGSTASTQGTTPTTGGTTPTTSGSSPVRRVEDPITAPTTPTRYRTVQPRIVDRSADDAAPVDTPARVTG